MRILPTLAIGCALAVSATTPVHAQQIWDNWNTDACGFTGTAVFDLDGPTRVNSVELWYRWRPRENDVGFTLLRHGRVLTQGLLTRAGCDPYQEAWCGARGEIGLEIGPGPVVIRVDRPRVCQNPGSGGEGFVKVFGRPL